MSMFVAACGGGGGSSGGDAPSGNSSSAVGARLPAVPSGLSWSEIRANTMVIDWDDMDGADNYKLSRNGVNPLVVIIADSNYTDSGVMI
ncbi:MAG: hypothetical protein K0U41_04635, partial [Gammaproteobacteria bacterium]|nr:hypothetical protein [Gammaproteobacteria bacterium]